MPHAHSVNFCHCSSLTPKHYLTSCSDSLPISSFCPLGIIDLSQVPHLPVLVPPSAGATSSPMDRITYIPGGSTTFPGRPYTTSPISPGIILFSFVIHLLCFSQFPFEISHCFFLFSPSLSSWVFTHKQDAQHIIWPWAWKRPWAWQREGEGPGKRQRAGKREGARTRPGEGSWKRARAGSGQRKRPRAWQREGWISWKCGARSHLATRCEADISFPFSLLKLSAPHWSIDNE